MTKKQIKRIYDIGNDDSYGHHILREQAYKVVYELIAKGTLEAKDAREAVEWYIQGFHGDAV